jgi:hypothetical protein
MAKEGADLDSLTDHVADKEDEKPKEGSSTIQEASSLLINDVKRGAEVTALIDLFYTMCCCIVKTVNEGDFR